jgi:hypothetical protein
MTQGLPKGADIELTHPVARPIDCPSRKPARSRLGAFLGITVPYKEVIGCPGEIGIRSGPSPHENLQLQSEYI